MKKQKTTVSRRSFLLTTSTLATVAALPSVWLGANPVLANSDSEGVESISFVGTSKIQLTIIDTKLTDPQREVVTDASLVRYRPTNNLRHRGYAQLGNLTGFISNDIHATAPQLFRPLAEVIAETELVAFDGQEPQIDQPGQWSVQINGSAVPVRGVFRKSVPIKSERTGRRDYAHTLRHLVTLEVPEIIPEGASISLNHPGLGQIAAERSNETLSEIVHVCQQGYPTKGPKKGYVGLWLGHTATGQVGDTNQDLSDALGWSLINTATGAVAMSGMLTLAKAVDDFHREDVNFNGCDVYEADFSSLDQEGEFRLVVDQIGSSFPFAIAPNPYQDSFRAAARWYFHQRSGIAIDAAFGEGRTRPRNGHPADGLTVWQSDVSLGQTREGFTSGAATDLVRETDRLGLMEETDQGFPVGSEHPKAWGGWHDAGDWDRRIQHMDVVFAMANMVELFASARKLDMNIPESGKPFADVGVMAKKSANDTGDGTTILPDLIHEALWGISLWRRTQTREGGIIGGVEYSSDGVSGAVSWNPHQHAFAYKTEPWAAYRFVIGAAKLGHVIATTVGDKVLGQQLMGEAENAWRWAETQWPDLVRDYSTAAEDAFDPADASEVPSSIFRARIAAASTLYRATGQQDARAIFEAHNPFLPLSELGSFGTRRGVYSDESMEYLRAAREGRDANAGLVADLGEWSANRVTGPKRMGDDYGLHATGTYPWGRGWARFGPGANWRASELALHYVTGLGGKEMTRDAVVEGMWFGLGCNPSNVSFVQGFGARQFADPSGSDYRGFAKVEGQIAFGVIIGEMYPWELNRVQGQFYPADQNDWPIYAQIFESSAVNTCAEHGMKANAMEWLFANAFVTELLAQD